MPTQVLCECLLYACCIRQRLTPADVSDLADLLHRLALRARAGGGADLAAQQQAYVALFAALLALLPLENADGADLEADERLLRELAASQELDAKLGGGGGANGSALCGGASGAHGGAEEPHGAVLRLAWGVLLSQYGPESAAGEWESHVCKCRLRLRGAAAANAC